MDTYILPFTTNVELKTYQFMAFPLGIIKANLVDYDFWLSNKFINCLFATSWKVFYYCETDVWSASDGRILKEERVFTPSFLNRNDSLIEFSKEQLTKNKYILGIWDESFIPGKKAYGCGTHYHDYIIYGFDNKKGVFKSAGYLKEGKYTYFDVKYEDYYNAVRKTTELDEAGAAYCSFHNNSSPKINITGIKEELNNYLCSRRDKENSDTGSVYGISTWDAYSQYILSEKKDNLDMRFSSCYMENKSVMHKRIKILLEQKYINNEKLAEEYFENIYLRAQAVHHMGLKYKITKKSEALQRMLRTVADINKREKIYIETLLSELEKTK